MKRFFCLILSALLLAASCMFATAADLTEMEQTFQDEYRVNDMLIMVGQTFSLSYDKDEFILEFSVDDSSIVSISGGCSFTGVSAGEATVTATVGTVSKSFTITVIAPEGEVTSIGSDSSLGFFADSEIFGEDGITYLDSDGSLFILTESGSIIDISDNAQYYAIIGYEKAWSSVYIITSSGTVEIWTYDTETATGTTEQLYNFVPSSVAGDYALTTDGDAVLVATGEVIYENLVSISAAGLGLDEAGNIIDLETGGVVAKGASALALEYGVVLMETGTLFKYEKTSGVYSASLIDSGVEYLDIEYCVYTKSGTTKMYNGERTLVLSSDFAASGVFMTDECALFATDSGEVYMISDLDNPEATLLGSDFSSFYHLYGYIGYKNSGGVITTYDGQTVTDYSAEGNSQFSLDGTSLTVEFSSSSTITAMEYVIQIAVDPFDGESVYILRQDGTVWYADTWTWYPRKTSESSRFYPTTLYSDYSICDVDEDGSIAMSDARLSLRGALGVEELSKGASKAADLDYNGEVTLTDSRYLLQVALGLAMSDFLNSIS